MGLFSALVKHDNARTAVVKQGIKAQWSLIGHCGNFPNNPRPNIESLNNTLS